MLGCINRCSVVAVNHDIGMTAQLDGMRFGTVVGEGIGYLNEVILPFFKPHIQLETGGKQAARIILKPAAIYGSCRPVPCIPESRLVVFPSVQTHDIK